MKKKLTWISLVLLVLTLAYWAVAVRNSPDFSNLGGNDRFRHHASICFAGVEATWILEQRRILIAVVTGVGKEDLPLLGRHDLLEVLFKERWKWSGPANSLIPYVAGVTTFRGESVVGRAITLRIWHVWLWSLAMLFAVLPAVAVCSGLLKRFRMGSRAIRVRRVRRARLSLGICSCGYDLRQSRRNCPECGRAIRWVPVNVPSHPGSR